MEMRDVYFRDGTKTGKTVAKHQKLEKGEWLLHAIAILKTEDGGYIMQQRSKKARHYPGQWDVTGGGVNAGETGAEGAAREVWEELGIEVDAEKMRFMLREHQELGEDTGLIIETYAARVSVPEGGFRLEAREVEGVKIVPAAEFIDTVCYNKSEAYRQMLLRTIREI